MKITNGEIFLAREPIQSLTELKLPVKVSLNVAKLANKLNDKLRAIDDVRNGLIKKHGEEKDGKIEVKPGGENFIAFVNDMNELFAQEDEIVFDPIELPDDVVIEPKVLMALEKFIK